MNELQTQLEQLSTRRADLARQLSAQRAAVQAAQAGLISGAGSAPDLSSARSDFESLQSALDALDAQIKDVGAQLEAANAQAAHDANLAACVALVADAQTRKAAFDAAFADACALLDARLNTLLGESDALTVARAEVEQRLQLTSQSNPDLVLLKQQSGPDAVNTLLAWGKQRPPIFDTITGTSLDVEFALGRAFERRDATNRQQTNRNTRSPFAEPPGSQNK